MADYFSLTYLSVGHPDKSGRQQREKVVDQAAGEARKSPH